jgi:DNA invertase Pin-like site-specific DNA recombinase
MPDAEDLMMRVHAAMAQKEQELISERTLAALAAARARGAVLGGEGAGGLLRPRVPPRQPWRGRRAPPGRRIGWR